MATSSTGSKIAAPQIFTSDPLEQAYAKGTLDPDMGGIAYAYMNAARGRREDNQNEYMQALREANLMSSRLAIHETDADVMKELIKSAAEQANAGIDPSTSPILSRLYDLKNPLTAQPSFLSRDLKAANAAKARADAAHAGDAGAPTYTYTQNVGPGGTPGDSTLVGKGRDPRVIQQTVQGMTTAPQPGQNTTTNPNATIRPDGSVGPPSIGAARSNANASGQQQRANEAKARAEAQRTQQRLQQVQ
jgi:hypothetical protein